MEVVVMGVVEVEEVVVVEVVVVVICVCVVCVCILASEMYGKLGLHQNPMKTSKSWIDVNPKWWNTGLVANESGSFLSFSISCIP